MKVVFACFLMTAIITDQASICSHGTPSTSWLRDLVFTRIVGTPLEIECLTTTITPLYPAPMPLIATLQAVEDLAEYLRSAGY